MHLCLKRPAALLLLAALAISQAAPAQDAALQIRLNRETGRAELTWEDANNRFLLERSPDLSSWAQMHPSLYVTSAPSLFHFSQPAGNQGYYRLRPAGQNRIYVIGNSISTRTTWPDDLEWLSGKHVFSQAIGGTTSDTMVHRAAGVEFFYPQKGRHAINPGPVKIKWKRHNARRMTLNDYRNVWADYAKTVSEPYTIEVFNNGEWLGCARRMTAQVTTDYAHDAKKLYWPGHPLTNGSEVVFFTDDPAYPSDLSVTDGTNGWRFSSPWLPGSIVERRVYYVANAGPDDFEIKEQSKSASTMDLGGNASGPVFIEYGWEFDWTYPGGDWNLTWKPRTKYDDWIWLLEVSANDFPSQNAITFTVTNTLTLLSQMTPVQQRFIIICPPSGHKSDRGPGSFNWTNYYDSYMPYIKTHFPSNHLDTMALLDAGRTATELGFLDDPAVPELLWIGGNPTNEATWQAYKTQTGTATNQMWVGPGYIPLQYRAAFYDVIHLNGSGNALLAGEINRMLTEKGW